MGKHFKEIKGNIPATFFRSVKAGVAAGAPRVRNPRVLAAGIH